MANWTDHFRADGNFSQPNVKAATYYGGIGGGLLGLAQSGIVPICGFDDRDFVNPELWHKSWGSYYASERAPYVDVEWKLPEKGEVNILIGSPPCKRFSSLAMRKKDRHDFDPDELEVIKFLKKAKELEVDMFILENLKNLLNFFSFEEDGTVTFIPKNQEVIKMGHQLFYRVLNSANFNAPQRRKRVFIFGIKKHLCNIAFPGFFDHLVVTQGILSKEFRTVKEAFENIDKCENMEVPSHSQKRIDGFAALKPGESYYGTQNNKRIHLNRPGPTITSHRTQYVHPTEPRTLTVRECARIMGFPDQFVFFGPRVKQLDQVGCGIVPTITEKLGTFIKTSGAFNGTV